MSTPQQPNGPPPLPPQPGTPEDLIPTAEAAKLAQCSPSALHRFRLKGRITGYRRVGRWFWSRSEILGLFVAVAPPRPPEVPHTKPGKTSAWAMEVLRRNKLIP